MSQALGRNSLYHEQQILTKDNPISKPVADGYFITDPGRVELPLIQQNLFGKRVIGLIHCVGEGFENCQFFVPEFTSVVGLPDFS